MLRALVCAGLSARLLAEAAAREGWQAWALDIFGDTDTRAAATHWAGIGEAAGLRLDGARLVAALRDAACHGGVIGWVAGSGFEAQAALLEAGSAVLPLLGTHPAAQGRVRDARKFFGTLERLGAPHPTVRFDAPPDARGWLVKQMDGCGGTHIRAADSAPGALCLPAPQRLWQRRVAGQPMSALFVANGRHARRLAFNRLTVRELGDCPYVYHGAVGPLALGERLTNELEALIDTLAAAFELQGLCSLDFMLDEDQRWNVLELNPRPSASMALYPQAGLLRTHLEACLHKRLPALALQTQGVRGHEVVFAPTPLRVSAARWGDDCHDRPAAGSEVAAGAPLCSISAEGRDAAATLARLAQRRRAVLETQQPMDMETT